MIGRCAGADGERIAQGQITLRSPLLHSHPIAPKDERRKQQNEQTADVILYLESLKRRDSPLAHKLAFHLPKAA